MSLRRIMRAVVMLTAPTFSVAQTPYGSLTGVVKALSAEGKPAAFPNDVRIWLYGSEDDKPYPISQENFTIAQIPAGDYEVEARALNFTQQGGRISVRIPGNGRVYVINNPRPIPLKKAASNLHPSQSELAAVFPPSGMAGSRLRLVLVANGAGPHQQVPPAPKCGGQTGRVEHAGQPVRGVRITVSQPNQAGSRLDTLPETLTDQDGCYTLQAPATPCAKVSCLVSARKPGFQPYRQWIQDGSELPGSVELKRLAPVRPAAQPEVSEGTQRRTWDESSLLDLPLAGVRTFDQLALLSPGVFPVAAVAGPGGPGLAPGVGSPGQFSVNGLRSRENNFTLDGSDNNDEETGARRQGFFSPVPQPIESVQEFEIITALAPVANGHNIAAQINVNTKHGGDGPHGAAFGFLTDNAWNARDFFQHNIAGGAPGAPLRRASDGALVKLGQEVLLNRVPAPGNSPLRRAQAGGAFGAPLGRRTHVYIAGEYQSLRSSRDVHFATPTVAQRGLNRSGETGLGVNVPYFSSAGLSYSLFRSTPATIPGNALWSLYPFPNNPAGPYGANTFTTRLRADGRGIVQAVKGTHDFQRMGQLIGRLNMMRDRTDLPVTGEALYSSLRPVTTHSSLAVIWNWSLTPALTNTFRGSFALGRFDVVSDGRSSPEPSRLLPGDPYLLNAPLILNLTRPGDTPRFVAAASPQGAVLLERLGLRGITDAEALLGPLGQVAVAGYSSLGVDVFRFPQMRRDNTLQFADLVTYVRGGALWRAGFDVRQVRLRSRLERNARPAAQFWGLVGTAFLASQADQFPDSATMAAMGVPAMRLHTLSLQPDPGLRLRSTQADFFGALDRNLGPRVRVSLGLRLAANRLPKDLDDVIAGSFRVAELDRQITASEARCAMPCPGLLAPLRGVVPGDLREVFGADRMGNDVRFGFAWDVLGNGRVAVRGGFGAFTGSFPAIVVGESRSGFPAKLPLNLANFPGYPFLPLAGMASGLTGDTEKYLRLLNLGNPAVRALDARLANLLVPGTPNRIATTDPASFDPVALLATTFSDFFPVLSPVFPAKAVEHPYAFQQALRVEVAMGPGAMAALGYVGTLGRKLLRQTTPDTAVRTQVFALPTVWPAIHTTPEEADAAPFPVVYGDLMPAALPRGVPGAQAVYPIAISRTVYEASSSSSFQSLQAELRGGLGRGLSGGVAFTYAHAIDDVSDLFPTAGAPALPQNSQSRSERASANFDSRFRLAAFWSWRLSGPSRRWVWNNWTLGGMAALQSGQPYTVNSTYDWNGDGNLTDRLNTTAGLEIQPHDPDPRVQVRLAAPASSLLAPRSVGFFRGDGAVGRNTFRAPGLASLDVALGRDIPLGEARRIQARLEAFNVFNRTHFGIPVRWLEAPGFGQSVNTLVHSRTLQIALRAAF